MHKLSLLMGKCGVRLWLLLCQGLNFAWLRRDYLFGSPGLMTFRTQLLRKPHIRRPGHIRLLLLGSGEVHNRLSHYSSVLLLSDVRVIYSSLRLAISNHFCSLNGATVSVDRWAWNSGGTIGISSNRRCSLSRAMDGNCLIWNVVLCRNILHWLIRYFINNSFITADVIYRWGSRRLWANDLYFRDGFLSCYSFLRCSLILIDFDLLDRNILLGRSWFLFWSTGWLLLLWACGSGIDWLLLLISIVLA